VGANRAKVVYESIEYGVLSIGRGTIPGGGKMLNSKGDQVVRSVIDSVICHRSSPLLFNSALNSVLNAVLHSALFLALPLLASGPPVL
jgi:hypothetical protein